MVHVGFGAPTEYNGTDTGGDSRMTNLNQWYQAGDQAFILLSSCLVLLMIPGIAFLYSGLARRKSALSMLWVSMMSFSVIVFQWYLWGYSLAFSDAATSRFVGDLRHFGLRGVWGQPSVGSPLIPALLYAFYQMQFCAVTAALVAGAVAERGRVIPSMIFIFFWATLVYCPLACWVWNPTGWGFRWGVLDYAGGIPVEIGSGMSALAYSWVLGRRNENMMRNFRPHNVSLILLGTIMLWFGWLGFNGGSAFGANLRAVMACWNSCLTAMFAAMTWCLLDYRLARKWSMVAWCSGTISGLVAATPASGFLDGWASIILGVVTGVCCNFGTKIKYLVGIDDALDIFAEHGIGGTVGLIFNAFFADDSIISLDGVNNTTRGGFVDRNYGLLYKQVAMILAASSYAFVVSALVAKAIDLVPGLQLRASEEAELLGMDEDQHGEFSYDYVEVRRDFLAWTPPQTEPAEDDVELTPQLGVDHGSDVTHHGVPLGQRDQLEARRPATARSARSAGSIKATEAAPAFDGGAESEKRAERAGT